MKYNIYCDESCHLENDGKEFMIIGSVKCIKSERRSIVDDIRKIKEKYNMNKFCEIKWTNVSPNKIEFYKEIVNYFFDNNHLTFRAVIIDKKQLNHIRFNQTHDEFYYKVYYHLLCGIIESGAENNIYLDIKDTKSANKVRKLQDILANSNYDFDRKCIKKVQNINSKESELLQLTDILIGALGYYNRREHLKNNYSQSKMEIVNIIKEKSGFELDKSTLLREEKFNLFFMELQK